jgi:hypothetical protein
VQLSPTGADVKSLPVPMSGVTDQGTADKTFRTVLSKPSETKLPPAVNALKERFKDLFKKKLEIKEQERRATIPYYTDVSTNTYSILGKVSDSADELTNGYNASLAAFIADSGTGTVSFFEDNGIKKEAWPIIGDVSVYIHKLKHAAFDWRVETGLSDSRALLFSDINNYVADLYWKQKLGFSPLVPKQVFDYYKSNTKKYKGPSTMRDVLIKRLEALNAGEQKDRFSNAFAYFIKQAVKEGMSFNCKYYDEEFIPCHKRFTPTLSMLSFHGKIPDLKVEKFKSLFLLSEWTEINNSAIKRAELEFNALIKKTITHSNLPEFLKKLQLLITQAETDRVSAEFRKIKRERLFVCSKLKGKVKAVSFNVSKEVARHISEPRILEAYNPLRIPFATGKLKTTPGEGIVLLGYDEKTESFYVPENEMSKGMDGGHVSAYVLEFAKWLNASPAFFKKEK